MDLKAYIESGVLELYALGLLDEIEHLEVANALSSQPTLREEYEDIQRDLEFFAFTERIEPSESLRTEVVDSILNLQKEKHMSLDDLPLINRYSNHLNWLKMIDQFDISKRKNGRFLKVLRQDEKITQILVVSTTDIEEEIHHAAYESFLILSGSCKCTIAGESTFMRPGDFMEIPLHKPHDVAIVNEPVTAILQLVNIN